MRMAILCMALISQKCLSLLLHRRSSSLLNSSHYRPAIHEGYNDIRNKVVGVTSIYSTTRPQSSSKDVDNGNNVSKKEAEMDEVKQAIKDTQVEIVNVGKK